MYSKPFTRKEPGCIVVLLDRSDSMDRSWAGSRMTLAHGAARAVNKMILELGVRSTKHGNEMRHYFDVGVFGYGSCPYQHGREGVESALGGNLAGRGLVPLPELAVNTVAVREEPSVDQGAPSSRVPVWIEPVHGQRTPMCEAIAVAGQHVFEWVNAHPESFPPIVINITDGWVTDSPYQGVNLAGWANRLSTIATTDGPTLLLNIFLSPETVPPSWFPLTGAGLPEPGPELFGMSSELPPRMIDNARAANIAVSPRARGLVFNADLEALVTFLEIGTRVGDIRDM